MIRRLSLFGALCTIVAAFAPAAPAATYVGSAVDDPRTRVEFVKDGGKIRGFEVRRAKYFCTHDPTFRDREGTVFGRMSLTRHGTFEKEFSNGSSLLARIRGSIQRERSSGDFRIDFSPRPSEECTTRRVEWTARRE